MALSHNKSLSAGLGTHAFRHTYRSWLDAVGTTIAVQQKMMRHTDIRTTMNIYGDVVTDEMTTAGSKVARLAFPLQNLSAVSSVAYRGVHPKSRPQLGYELG
jgi:site-specific recombinase XerD